jgi:hypothetical protein
MKINMWPSMFTFSYPADESCRKPIVSSVLSWVFLKQYKQCTCTYNVTLWRVHVTLVAIETQQYVLYVLFSYMSLSAISKYWVLHKNAFFANLCRWQQ